VAGTERRDRPAAAVRTPQPSRRSASAARGPAGQASITQRKPMLPVAESGVFEERAATR
jgi:hypothetical protein